VTNYCNRIPIPSLGLVGAIIAGLLGALGAPTSAYAYGPCAAEVAVTITSLSPVGSVAAGNYPVSINGSNLGNTTQVTFGGVDAPIQSNTGTKIVVTAPPKPGGGVVSVVLLGNFGDHDTGSACDPKTSYTSPFNFTYVVPAIVVSSVPALLTQVGLAFSQQNSATGGNGSITFTVATGTLPLGTTLNASSGLVSGTPTTAGPFSYSITATDSPVSTPATGPVLSGTIAPPALAVQTTPSATTQVGSAYSQANIASGGVASYTYSLGSGLLPAGTTLDSTTGVVSGTPTMAGFFSYSISATDSSAPPQTATSLSVSGTITGAALSLTSTPSAQTQVGQPYSQTNVASGGTGLYTYTLNTGLLPAGTTLNPNTGTVSGIPTTAGPISYNILVTDSTGATGSNAIGGTISGPGFTLTSTPSATTRVGKPYSQVNVASFGTLSYSYAVTSGSVPAGTILNTSSGIVSGTPTVAGPFTYDITATDSSGVPQTSTRTLSGTIEPPTLTIVSTPSAQTKIGQVYSQSNTASGGTPAYTYTLYFGSLPAGTTLNASTGLVSGTPTTQGLFYYAILATDSGAPAQTATSLTVSGMIGTAVSTTSLTSSANPSTFGQPVTFTATVSAGATGTVTFKEGTTTLGSGPVLANIATFTTSTLAVGTHSITAVYGGDASFSPSTSSALQQSVSVPADSVKLRAMQIAGTQMAAQLSSQAISGAIDNAIEAGFSDGGPAVTPNGSGFYFNFAAESGAQSNASPQDGVRSFIAAPDRKADRIDDSFSALGYRARASNAPPKTYAPQREWLPWIDVRGVSVNSKGVGNDLKGDQFNFLAGLTRKFSPQFLVGVFGGFERIDFTSDALAGRLKGDGWTVGSYLGWRIDQNLRFDLAVAHSSISYDNSAGAASGTFPGSRWLTSGGFTGLNKWQGFTLEPSLRAYVMWEHESAYTDSLGITQLERNFTTGRASAGNKVSYPITVSAATVTPYVGIYGDYYFSRDDASMAALAPTPLLQGWSARVTSGLGVNLGGGAQISAGAEYGGIGGNTQIWTWRARGSVPF
jgi:Big-like domain-containing protein/autotransporter-like protein/putative Ig domain-containing protein/IPT/TIG domain-containing protein